MTLPLEVYVARVLAGEGEPRAAEAAQQALAVAIRTFTLANVDRHVRDGFDLCDTTHCQVLRPASAASRRAVASTAGRVLTWQGAIAEVFYSASCGGRSEAASQVWPGADYQYLRSIADNVHDDDERWTVDLALRDVQRALARTGFEGKRLKDVRIDARSSSGRVTRLKLTGMRPDVVSGEQFRAAVGTSELRSTAFSVKKRGDSVRLTGRGFGHGVGLCVIGAGRRAARGDSVRAILAQYYPGLEVTQLDEESSAPSAPVVTAAARPLVAPPAAVVPRASGVSVRVSPASLVSALELGGVARRAHEELSTALGTSVAPVTIQLHDTIDSFRSATGRPWWVSFTTSGTTIDLAPAAVLSQRDGVDVAIRMAMAELLVSSRLADRPAWVRVGAARYFGRPAATAALSTAISKVRCPSDAELLLAISATAQREADGRAEACFARELAKEKDWRTVR